MAERDRGGAARLPVGRARAGAFPTDRRLALSAGLRGGAAVALFAAGTHPAQGASIVAVRVWPAKDYTRVTLELDRPLRFSWQSVHDPERLVVDLEGIELDGAIRDLIAKVQPNDPYIRQVRVGQFRPGVVRIVLDLKVASQPQVFPLAPVANYRHRLVLDLRPAVPIDPLAQLIERQAQAGRAPSPDRAAPTSPEASSVPASPRAPGSAASDPLDAVARSADERDRTRSGTRSVEQTPPAETPSGQETRGGQPPGGQPRGSQATRSPTRGGQARDGQTRDAGTRDDATPDGDAPGDETQVVEGPGRAVRGGRRAPLVSRLVTIAIDPGHGGEDPGAIGARGTQEKDVVLRVARRLRARIDAEPNLRAFLTRDGDFFVPLGERVRKARAVRADLFVSIHADAFVNPEARGASVFVLSERGASSTAARWLARKENESDQIGGVDLGSRDREVASLLLDLSTRAQIEHSLRLGRAVLDGLSGVGRLHKPQVEQAGFAVLKAPDIPSILVETAFISNPQEEARLSDEAYQARLAEAIFDGIRSYFQRWPPAVRGRST